MRYMGVNSFFCPPATRLSAAKARLSAVFCVPLGARPMRSNAPTKRCTVARPSFVMRRMVKKSQ